MLFRVHCAVLNTRPDPSSGSTRSQRYGGHGERETPGHIPNPEAKPLSADGTALATGWESRTPPDNPSTEGPQPPGRGPFACLTTAALWLVATKRGSGSTAAGFLRRRTHVVGEPGVQGRQLVPGG